MTLTAGGPRPAAETRADDAADQTADDSELLRLDAWWRAANYLAVG
jgi:phosphoketolase